ncbi:MAG TPA: AAA family ATPase, partial [Pirellulaceae bacterium]|nr:AAA family ATPase [Pirellulaceae bacterium]
MRKPTDPPFVQSVTLMREWVKSFDEFPFSIPAIKHLHTLTLHPRVTFFVGENGSGKSTLLEGIAVAEGFNPEGGSRHAMFKTRD